VRTAAVVGIGLAFLGVIDGLKMALHSHVVTCPSGTMSSGNLLPVCHSYPDASLGFAVMLLSGLLGIVVVLAAVAALAVLRGAAVQVNASSNGSAPL
jgi:hypothetical protein